MSNALKFASGMMGGARSLYSIINGLGLTSNLKLCLDAGDNASYDPVVQTAKWLDMSGNGYDFYRGSSGVADAAEPTFNGAAGGMSSAEYFSFDGADYFVYDAANETWMENLHKNNAVFSFFAMVYPAAIAALQNRDLFSTCDSPGPGVEMRVSGGATGTLKLRVASGASDVLNIDGTDTLAWSAWHGLGMSINEATGADGLIFSVDSTTTSHTSTYTSPTATAASHALVLGARTIASSLLNSGTRIGCMAMWEGAALTATNLTDIFAAIRGRYGL